MTHSSGCSKNAEIVTNNIQNRFDLSTLLTLKRFTRSCLSHFQKSIIHIVTHSHTFPFHFILPWTNKNSVKFRRYVSTWIAVKLSLKMLM